MLRLVSNSNKKGVLYKKAGRFLATQIKVIKVIKEIRWKKVKKLVEKCKTVGYYIYINYHKLLNFASFIEYYYRCDIV